MGRTNVRGGNRKRLNAIRWPTWLTMASLLFMFAGSMSFDFLDWARLKEPVAYNAASGKIWPLNEERVDANDEPEVRLKGNILAVGDASGSSATGGDVAVGGKSVELANVTSDDAISERDPGVKVDLLPPREVTVPCSKKSLVDPKCEAVCYPNKGECGIGVNRLDGKEILKCICDVEKVTPPDDPCVGDNGSADDDRNDACRKVCPDGKGACKSAAKDSSTVGDNRHEYRCVCDTSSVVNLSRRELICGGEANDVCNEACSNMDAMTGKCNKRHRCSCSHEKGTVSLYVANLQFPPSIDPCGKMYALQDGRTSDLSMYRDKACDGLCPKRYVGTCVGTADQLEANRPSKYCFCRYKEEDVYLTPTEAVERLDKGSWPSSSDHHLLLPVEQHRDPCSMRIAGDDETTAKTNKECDDLCPGVTRGECQSIWIISEGKKKPIPNNMHCFCKEVSAKRAMTLFEAKMLYHFFVPLAADKIQEQQEIDDEPMPTIAPMPMPMPMLAPMPMQMAMPMKAPMSMAMPIPVPMQMWAPADKTSSPTIVDPCKLVGDSPVAILYMDGAHRCMSVCTSTNRKLKDGSCLLPRDVDIHTKADHQSNGHQHHFIGGRACYCSTGYDPNTQSASIIRLVAFASGVAVAPNVQ